MPKQCAKLKPHPVHIFVKWGCEVSKLTTQELTAVLKNLAKHNAAAWHLRNKLANHCEEVYGVDPAAVDNDLFIDAVDGGCGPSCGMTAKLTM